MASSQILKEDVDSWETLMFLYNSALKEVGTKLDILNDEFVHIHKYNPIEYIKKRIKTPESIVKKLKRDGYEVSVENMVNYINDIAGIRIVCSFTSDIYRLAEMIGKQNDLTVVSIKDYIKHPKASGYKSFHMHVTIPIFLSDRVVDTKVEIQIRTIAMDFWASLEHKIYYKFEGHAPEYISRDLRACAEIVSDLDAKMLQLNEAILEEKAKQEEENKKIEEMYKKGLDRIAIKKQIFNENRKKKENEYKQFTFKPITNKDSIIFNNVKIKHKPEFSYNIQSSWYSKVLKNNDIRKIKFDEEEIQQCTFTPKISELDIDNDYTIIQRQIPVINDYVNQRRTVIENSKKLNEENEKIFGNNKNFQIKITVPKEFRFNQRKPNSYNHSRASSIEIEENRKELGTYSFFNENKAVYVDHKRSFLK